MEATDEIVIVGVGAGRSSGSSSSNNGTNSKSNSSANENTSLRSDAGLVTFKLKASAQSVVSFKDGSTVRHGLTVFGGRAGGGGPRCHMCGGPRCHSCLLACLFAWSPKLHSTCDHEHIKCSKTSMHFLHERTTAVSIATHSSKQARRRATVAPRPSTQASMQAHNCGVVALHAIKQSNTHTHMWRRDPQPPAP